MSTQPGPRDAIQEYGLATTPGSKPRVNGGEPATGQAAAGAVDGHDPDEDQTGDPGPGLIPSPSDPMAVARHLVAARLTHAKTVVIRAWRGGFRAWNGKCWPEIDEASVRAKTYKYLEHASYEGKKETEPWQPTRAKVANVIEALKAITHLPPTVQPPAWLAGEGPDPRDLLVTSNGILHVPTRKLMKHDPRLFIGHAVPFAYEPKAPAPTRWLAFLRELWPGDEESVALVQEMFGYILSGATSLQKILLLVGPTRAGKGVIANVLTHLCGRESVGAPTLAGLTTNFGLQDLIGKILAVVSDARLGPRADLQALAERLLSISGEDSITIDRKYKEPWTGRLEVRFLLLTNELPRFTDASGALAKRFVVAVLQQSFYGREDPKLLAKLLPELPGILNWALDGLDRLREQGHFTQPASAREAIRDLEDLASPISAFVRDRCRVGRDQQVRVDDLWTAWKAWCEDGSQHHGTKQTFGRDLRAAVPGLRVSRPRDGEHHRVYQGVGLSAGGPNDAEDGGPRGPSGPETDSWEAAGSPEPLGPHGPRPPAMSSPAPTIQCSDFRAHQSSHRLIGESWVCERCDEGVGIVVPTST